MRTATQHLCGSIVILLVLANTIEAVAQKAHSAMEPGPAALEEFSTGSRGEPFYMLNLLKFAPDGRTEYFRYALGAGKHIQQREGSMRYIGRVEACGDAPATWDGVAIVRYPTRDSFLEVVADPDYQNFLPHLRAALDRTLMYAFVNAEELPERLDATTADYGPDSVVIVGLQRLRHDSLPAYARYQRESRRLITQFGGGVLFAAEGDQALVGTGQWDRLVLVHFPSLHQLEAMIGSAPYTQLLELRAEAIADTQYLLTRPSAAP